MTTLQILIGLIPVGFFVGSIPFGFIVGKMKGIDVRAAGSGNIGATNVGRLLGRKFGILVFLLDVMKGALPMLIASMLLLNESNHDSITYILWLTIGFATILGHMFPPWLKFKGGKGVATGLGVLFGLWPYYTLCGAIVFVVWIVIFLVTKYVSVASILSTVCFPIIYVIIGINRGWDPFGKQLPLFVYAMVVGLMIVYKHRTNISRLMAGTENRFGKKENSATENKED
jgi:glycerol-3-phosphate acyltransferase PlsY